MTTTMYLRNDNEVAAAARIIKQAGYSITKQDIKRNDRYVMNIVNRLGGRSCDQEAIAQAIVAEVMYLRNR